LSDTKKSLSCGVKLFVVLRILLVWMLEEYIVWLPASSSREYMMILKWILGKYGMGFVQDSDRGGPREHSSEILGFTKGV
jgi:hypothetical protein